MSYRLCATWDKGVVVNTEELNLQKLKEILEIKEEMSDEDIIEELKYAGQLSFGDGYIQHKDSYGDCITGDFINLIDMVTEPQDIFVEDDDWVMFDLIKYPNLFKQAYKDENELIEEMKRVYSSLLADPEHFDWVNRLVTLYGVVGGGK